MLLTLEEIKSQLRLDDDFSDEDTLLVLLGRAVQSRTETFLNRKLYARQEDILEDDSAGLVLPDDVRLGMLLLLTHFYENRSAVSEVEKLETPLAYNWLVGPYRYIPL
ncbi:head-tail connector protein [Escherichia coli]|uniref:head-tail connector protein n=1 Tax=Escherichia coli TaxID=562 RepID=UPI000DF8942B|nr:head-tail connector protein [Escherichia coli]EFP6908610.1 phage gp6-like head-tail connector protein [Shigella dysenteriae]EFL5716725.1 phage gp6-like head-tail connector protein [Escherichia coli]EFP7033430.1 phage gp6-like head-tail connector protein [Shigella dysenteriae]EFW3898113.1 phage gp6-like head-tail connector protein [Shigella dysenteriae]MCX3825143.1 phage gp6-like head-tail connector protein [Escherichia coli]